MNLKTVTIADLKPHPENPNTHPSKQIDALVESLDEFDQVKNIVVWKGHILAGHGVVEAAIKSGRLTLEAVDVSHWPEEKAKPFMLADIRLPDMAFVDDEILVEALRTMDAPLEIPGFDETYLSEISDTALSIEALNQALSGGPVSADRAMGDKKKQIKPVLYVDEIKVFEDAIQSTGLKNRGQAITEICRFYLDKKERQFDFQAESVIKETSLDLPV